MRHLPLPPRLIPLVIEGGKKSPDGRRLAYLRAPVGLPSAPVQT